MSTKSRVERRESVLSAVQFGGKLLFYLGVFLFLLEVASLFGASSRVSKLVDVMAIIVTTGLLLLALSGVRIVSFFFNRLWTESKESSAL